MTKHTNSKGFTIVELLIVIVVIAILAAITIVAYNGIQNRAHTTAQKTAAENVAKKIESYNAIKSGYPAYAATATGSPTGPLTAALNGVTDSSLTGSGLVLSSAAPAATASDGTVTVYLCGATAAPSSTVPVSGFYVSIYDRTISPAAANPVQAGGTVSIGAPNASGVNAITHSSAGGACTLYN